MRDDDAEQLPPVKGIEDERGINPTSLRFVFSFKNRAEDTCSHTSNASHCRKPESCFMVDELFLWCGRLSASCALRTTSLQKTEGGGGGGGRRDMKESFPCIQESPDKELVTPSVTKHRFCGLCES